MTASAGLLQISDPHFGTEIPRVVDALRALARRLLPSVVVISGDITQRATARQFHTALEFLRSLEVAASVVLPGNHDVPLVNLALRAFAPYRRYRRAFGDDLEPVHDEARLLVVGVNTVVPYWHQQGAVSRDQVERVSRRLRQAAPEQLRVVACHHPVHVIRPEDDRNLLHGADPAVREWVRAGADVVMGGHIHLPYLRPLRQRLPDLPRTAWIAQAGTAVSARLRPGAPNSVNFLQPVDTPRGLACRAQRWDFAVEAGAFRCVASQELLLDRTIG